MALQFARVNGVVGVGAADDAARVAAASVGLFGLAGFALTRLALPTALRRHETLWILPVGAAATAIAMTVLGFAAVPFRVSIGAVLVAGAVSSAIAVRRTGLPSPRTAAWPAYLAVLVACVALVPVFRAGFPTVIGNGSDSVLAVGSAKFVQGHYPTSVAVSEPIDRMPLVWRSKQAIYYAFGAVASLAGLETFQALPLLAAILLALAATGFYVLARDVLGGGLLAGCLALLAVGLDQVSLHTTMHPYFNQLWGFVALPWAFALSWAVAKHPSRGAITLLALFLLLGAFAYPLALPIALIPLLVLRPPRLRRPRFRWWMVPLGLALLVPLGGVLEKATAALKVVGPNATLRNWGGDLEGWFGLHTFLFTGSTLALVVAAPLLAAGLVVALRSVERRLALGLAAVVAFGALCAVYFRLRDFGWYFHFKALAFTGPVTLAIAMVGLARLRDRAGRGWRVGMTVALVGLVLSGLGAAQHEIGTTFDQLPRDTLALRSLPPSAVPPGASVRLDVVPDNQLWTGYMLSAHPQCAQRPLLGTNYPHVPIGRKADLILADVGLARPFDAVGPPLYRNGRFAIYRMNPAVGGPSTCSRRLIETVTKLQ